MVTTPSPSADPAEGPKAGIHAGAYLAAPHVWCPRERALPQAHLPVWEGRRQLCVPLPGVAVQLASPPTLLCTHPTSKARATIKGRKRKETKRSPRAPPRPLCSVRTKASCAKCQRGTHTRVSQQ